MNTKPKQTLYLSFACIVALLLLLGVLAVSEQTRLAAYAAPLDGGTTFLPLITITQPAPNAILTNTPQLIAIQYRCTGDTLCLGSAQITTMSLTVSGDAGPYYPASPALSGTLGGLYTYNWSLDDQDYVSHTLRARARDGWGQIAHSPPLSVYVDTIPPRQITLTAPIYTEDEQFPISWSASDGSGLVRYDLQYRRNDQAFWTDWLTNSSVTSQTFTVSAQEISKGYHYIFRVRARDKGYNLSDWVSAWTRVGRYRLYLPLTIRYVAPLWRQAAGTQGTHFRAPVGCENTTWYAGTYDTAGVWKSTDSAQTWQKIANLQPFAYPVVVDPANCQRAFVSVWGRGVYHLAGDTPLAINQNLGELYVYSLALTNTTLYAATDNLGIYRTDVSTGVNWQTFNDGLDDLRIRSLYLAGNKLYAGGKGCRIYTWNDDDSAWEAQSVLTDNCENASVRSIALVRQTLYAGLGLERGLYHDGATWQQVAAIPSRPIYGLAYDDVYGYLYVSVYGAGVYRCQVDAQGQLTACAPHNLGLTSLSTREIHIHNRQLVVSSDDGLWYQPLTP
jgi:hypothetical protein